ncbi:50S ribosomal protein L22 [Candidatus Woesearchaeota archaeon]|nr:50S ribosomal protein L22 [Candidatus Woesearchaeota archaeon]
MATHHYAFEGYDKEHMARVVGRDLSISTRQSVEVCHFIRGRNLQWAKQYLQDVIAMKKPIPFKRYNKDVGHKKGDFAAARYPQNCSTAILALLNSVEANAQEKGLNTANLVIKHSCAHMASRPFHTGRFRGRKMKRSHVEVVVVEMAKEQKKEKAKKVKSVKP